MKTLSNAWRHAVTKLVEASYKSEGRGFDYRWCQWNFSFRPHCDPMVHSASNRNEYQEFFVGDKGGRCVGLTALPPSYAYCLEILDLGLLKPSGPVQVRNGTALPLFNT